MHATRGIFRYSLSMRDWHPGCYLPAIARSLSLYCFLCIFSPVWAAGHPDFTGVWGVFREPGEEGRPRFRAPPPELPLTEAARQKVEAYRSLVAATGDTPGGHCLGTGMPGNMLGSGGYPMEIVQHPDLLVVIYEAHSEVRHIQITNVAGEADLFPDRNGYSVGHWDGNRLVVETTHLKEAVDQMRYPHSANARILEEYEMIEDGDGGKVLVANMTLLDPDFYTSEVHAEKKWTFLPGVRLLPYECNEPDWYDYLDELRRKQGQGE